MKNKLFVSLVFLATLFPAPSVAQESATPSKYLAGAVPTVNGQVVFEETYEVPGKSKLEIYGVLKAYTEQEILKGENHLEQCALTETDSLGGLLAASVEERLYFTRKAWVSHSVRFYYQLIYRINDERFTVCMRRINYMYDDVPREEDLRAEDWITDGEALNKDKTKLTRKAGKFRKHTIDRKDQIFQAAAAAARGGLVGTERK